MESITILVIAGLVSLVVTGNMILVPGPVTLVLMAFVKTWLITILVVV